MRFWTLFFISCGSLAVLLLIGVFYGFYYEEGTDSYIKMLLSGDLTGTPEKLFNYGIHTFTSLGLFKLYSLLPNINWYDYYTGILLLAATILFVALLRYLKKYKEQSWLQLVLLSVLFAENLFLIQVTRISFLLSAFSILSVIIIQKQLNISLRKKQFITALMIFVLFISYCTRFEPPLLVTAVIFCFQVSEYVFSISLKSFSIFFKQQKIFLLFFSIAIVALLLFKIPLSETDSRFIEVRQYTYNLWDFKSNQDKILLTTRKDSVAYFTACNFFIADSHILNKQFFDRIGVMPMDKSLSNLANYFRDIRGIHKLVFRKFSNTENVLFVFLGLYSLWFIAGIFFQSKRWVLPLCITSFFFLLIIIFMKGEFRVISPLLFISYLTFVVTSSRQKYFFPRIMNLVSIVVVATCFIISCGRAVEMKTNAKGFEKLRDELAGRHLQKPVFVNLGVFEKFRLSLFDKNYVLKFCSVDNGYLFLYENQKKKLEKLVGSSDFIDVIDFIAEEQVNVVSDANRINILVNYTNNLYNRNYRYEKISSNRKNSLTGIYVIK